MYLATLSETEIESSCWNPLFIVIATNKLWPNGFENYLVTSDAIVVNNYLSCEIK
jgi:hypothetical protein